jgi:nucleoside 2-deoxyribosyltransferase
MPQLRVYLAGPEVFLPDAVRIGSQKKILCEEYGFIGLFPFDNEQKPLPSPMETARAIYLGNVSMMSRADFIIANLTPFRGPSADLGTVFELGMVAGMKKPTLGYTNNDRDFRERTCEFDGLSHFDQRRSALVDSSGLAIEDFELFDNLMIDRCLAESGFPVIRQRVPAAEKYTNLSAFRACLEVARQRFLLPVTSSSA